MYFLEFPCEAIHSLTSICPVFVVVTNSIFHIVIGVFKLSSSSQFSLSRMHNYKFVHLSQLFNLLAFNCSYNYLWAVISAVTIIFAPLSLILFISVLSLFLLVSLFSHSVEPDSLSPHGLWHARLPCPSASPRACSNSCPLSQWCHSTILPSVIPFSSCLQSFPASESFLMSQLFHIGDPS